MAPVRALLASGNAHKALGIAWPCSPPEVHFHRAVPSRSHLMTYKQLDVSVPATRKAPPGKEAKALADTRSSAPASDLAQTSSPASAVKTTQLEIKRAQTTRGIAARSDMIPSLILIVPPLSAAYDHDTRFPLTGLPWPTCAVRT